MDLRNVWEERTGRATLNYRCIAQEQKYGKVMKGKDLHPRLLYPSKLSFRMEGQIKCFSVKVKLKEFIITKPLLYEMLKGFV